MSVFLLRGWRCILFRWEQVGPAWPRQPDWCSPQPSTGKTSVSHLARTVDPGNTDFIWIHTLTDYLYLCSVLVLPKLRPSHLNVHRAMVFQSCLVQCWWAGTNCSLSFLFLPGSSDMWCGLWVTVAFPSAQKSRAIPVWYLPSTTRFPRKLFSPFRLFFKKKNQIMNKQGTNNHAMFKIIFPSHPEAYFELIGFLISHICVSNKVSS